MFIEKNLSAQGWMCLTVEMNALGGF